MTRLNRTASEPLTALGLWEPPAELRRYLPRQVRYSSAGLTLYAVAVLLLMSSVGSGIALWIAAEGAMARRAERRRDAVTATAEVVEIGRTRGENRRRFLVYRYEVGGAAYRGRVTLRQRDRRVAEVGSPLEIRYLPRDPARAWVPGYEPDGVPVWVAVVIPAALSLSAWPLFYMLRRQRLLLAHGRAAEARAIHVKKTLTGEGHAYRVQYEFRTLSGARKVARFNSSKEVKVGRVVTILYDRDNPASAAIYPLSLVTTR